MGGYGFKRSIRRTVKLAAEPTVAFYVGDVRPVVYRVTVADTPAKHAMGLMGQDNLAMDRGMLFVFETPKDHKFWMMDTPLPLDIIFMGEDGTVLKVIAETEPYSTQNYSAGVPSTYVLEINGGEARKRGIAENQKALITLS